MTRVSCRRAWLIRSPGPQNPSTRMVGRSSDGS
eukprot:CAMPEP_0198272042 /NCGR_PEP_ID=MMETSP1447-20131203/51568_1 /TAXON_ID=420782 /ORGANISM="Chaetoceros dichaeta, Strain CCMP1751" /LENGTH=32 /DNA_ID= /DNA_START= /DNA_END= /DNA_ORIENTATION=